MADPTPNLWARLAVLPIPGQSAAATGFTSNLNPFTVELVAEKKALPYTRALKALPEKAYTQDEITALGIKPVYLQVWHAGTLLKSKVDSDSLNPGKDPILHQLWSQGRSNKDELVCAVPGFIVQLAGQDKYQFRTLDDGKPIEENAGQVGWFWLMLHDSLGKEWPQPRTNEFVTWTPALPIPTTDAEQAGCFVCVLADAADAPLKGDLKSASGRDLTFINLVFIAWQMVLEGGLTCVLHLDSPAKSKDAKDFARTASLLSLRFGSLGLSPIGASVFGWQSTPVSGDEQSIIKAVAQIRDLVDKLFIQRIGLQPFPWWNRVRRIVLAGNGEARAGKLSGTTGALLVDFDSTKWLAGDGPAFQSFVDALAPHLTSDAVISLHAGFTACPPGLASDDGTGDFARYPGTPGGDPQKDIGKGSFADVLQKALNDSLKKEVAKRGPGEQLPPRLAVWGQVSQKKSGFNPALRVFTNEGAADAVWMADGWPPRSAPTATIKAVVKPPPASVLSYEEVASGIDNTKNLGPHETRAASWDARFPNLLGDLKAWVPVQASFSNPTLYLADRFKALPPEAAFDIGVNFTYQSEPARAWAHASCKGKTVPLLVFLHGNNGSGFPHPSLDERQHYGTTNPAGWMCHLGKQAQKMIDDKLVIPMAIAAPTNKAASGPWGNFDLASFVDETEKALAAAGVKIDRDRVSVAGHSGAGGSPGHGLNKIAEAGGAFAGHQLVVLGIADTSIDQAAGPGYVAGLKGNTKTAVYAVFKLGGGWRTSDVAGLNKQFGQGIGATKKKSSGFVTPHETPADFAEDCYDNDGATPLRMTIKMKVDGATLKPYLDAWSAAGGYHLDDVHGDMVSMWAWYALPRFYGK